MSYEIIDRFLRNSLDDDDYAEYSAALDALASAPPAPQVVPRKIPTPPAQADMLDVAYAEGWNQCCDTFFGGLPPQEPVVITITESAPPAPQASMVKQEPVDD